MLTLYEYVLSAECYAVRLLSRALGVEYRSRHVEVYPGREHEREPFVTLNPLSTLPTLDAGDWVLGDWQAILTYLAASHDPMGRWLPVLDPLRLAGVMEFLAMARALGQSAGAARLHDAMGVPTDIERSRSEAHRLMRVLDSRLWFGEQDGRDWLVAGEHPTIADIAVFVHVILSEEGGVHHLDYPAVRRWTNRCRRMQGFLPMSGVFEPPAQCLQSDGRP